MRFQKNFLTKKYFKQNRGGRGVVVDNVINIFIFYQFKKNIFDP